jgi:hypothetical protein
MMTEKPQEQSASAVNAPISPMDAKSSRRGLLKGLGVGSPILLTLSSAPVQAASVCIMPSGYISAATFNSRHPGATVCTSQGPTFFRNNVGNPSYWPTSGTNTQTTQFKNSALFQSQPDNSNNTTKSNTMAQVLNGSYASDFTKYCIAAYLNARIVPLGWPTDLTPAKVVALWRYFKAGAARPNWVPSAWTLANAQTWLSTLMSP